jgi:hypothetical protein
MAVSFSLGRWLFLERYEVMITDVIYLARVSFVLEEQAGSKFIFVSIEVLSRGQAPFLLRE